MAPDGHTARAAAEEGVQAEARLLFEKVQQCWRTEAERRREAMPSVYGPPRLAPPKDELLLPAGFLVRLAAWPGPQHAPT